LAAQLRRPCRIEHRRELDDDGLRTNKGAHGFDMEALGMLRVEPPPPDRRTDGYGKIVREDSKVDSMFGTHTTSMFFLFYL
jgi:hypothetical protein